MTASSNLDSTHWRLRAEECRKMAETFTSLQARERILRVAKHFERMAEHAHQRELDSTERRGRSRALTGEGKRLPPSFRGVRQDL